ncbi:MAG TPA: glycosyltransferase [Mucilaginibacter sp.]|nr:glycosyltransferase [Mucilaginibacter sp.]
MKILLIMDPGIPVPPVLYGGIERIVYILAEQYMKMGHHVTLLAGPDSYCSGTTIIFGSNQLDKPKSAIRKEVGFVWSYVYRHRKEFDLIHNFGRLVYLLPVLNHPVKKIMSYQREVTKKNIRLVAKLPTKNLLFTACSGYCVSTGNVAGRWEVIYNTIDFAKYQLTEKVDDDDAPLMFLGRLDKIKGVHTAIQVALQTGNKLIIGGNISHTPDNYEYFKTEIEPLLDGKQIKYLGALNDADKNKYLGLAKALLFPIEWGEPFGIVMIEAMACGTPVIAFPCGSVPEVVTAGTGVIANGIDEMISAVNNLKGYDRKRCRETARKRFDAAIIAKQYLDG